MIRRRRFFGRPFLRRPAPIYPVRRRWGLGSIMVSLILGVIILGLLMKLGVFIIFILLGIMLVGWLLK
jgi:hypothetical protein